MMALRDWSKALQRAAPPKTSAGTRTSSASRVRKEIVRPVAAENGEASRSSPPTIALTMPASCAIACGAQAVADPGDEVNLHRPPWFFYEVLCVEAGLGPVKVNAVPETFDLDVEAIGRRRFHAAHARGDRQHPEQSDGPHLSPATLEALARLLEGASRRNGGRSTSCRTSPTAGSCSTADRSTARPPTTRTRCSPTANGKVLLHPGSASASWRCADDAGSRGNAAQHLADALSGAHMWPSALMQHALADLDALSIDIPHLNGKRDRMLEALVAAWATRFIRPRDVLNLLPRSPWADDVAFSDQLGEHDILVLPAA